MMPQVYRCVKGCSIDDDFVSGAGYIVCDALPEHAGPRRHRLSRIPPQPFAFVFGMVGIGYHYRLDVRPADSVMALYQVRDGVPVFLHHLQVNLDQGSVITVDLFHSQIRVGLNGFQILHALGDPVMDPRVGFSPVERCGFRLPLLEISPLCLPPLNWLCLGDGFSNARWRNRSFLSWPELVLGDREDWFNGCVAAGNSRRVRQLTWDLAPMCHSAKVLLAVGSDDLIEGEPYGDFESRLAGIVAALRSAHLPEIHVATLPPRASALEATREWSEQMTCFARLQGLGLLDFHSWLLPRMDLMVRGEYPGAEAQALLASRVAEELGIRLPTPPLCNRDMVHPAVGRLLRKVHGWLDSRLADFPGLLR